MSFMNIDSMAASAGKRFKSLMEILESDSEKITESTEDNITKSTEDNITKSTEDNIIKSTEDNITKSNEDSESKHLDAADTKEGETELFHDSIDTDIDPADVALPSTPTELSTNQLLMKMYNEFREIKLNIKEMTSKIDFAMDEIVSCKRSVKDLEMQSKSQTDDLQIAKNEIVALKSENKSLLNRLIQQDSYTRRSNLIFYGVKQVPDEVCGDVIKSIIRRHLGIENVESMRFERCHRLPVPVDPKPIIVRFNWFEDRSNVWKCRMKLRGSNISLREDFPSEIVERRKTLYPVFKKAKELNKNAYMVADKLHIDGTVYTESNLHTLPAELDPATLSTKKIGNVTAFFSKSSPLSNFYDTQIEIENETFQHVEQYFQLQKAMFAGNRDKARQIRNAKSPAVCKKIGDSIETDKSWLPAAKETMTRACAAKFKQNTRARNFLLDTGDTIIAEASKDKYWGIGIPLSAVTIEQANSIDSWTGHNVLGEILMAIRAKLRKDFLS